MRRWQDADSTDRAVVVEDELATHDTGGAAVGAGRVLLCCETGRRDCKGDCNTSWSSCKKAAVLAVKNPVGANANA